MKNLILVLLAVLLFVLLEPISFIYVTMFKKRFKWSRITGYWYNLTIAIDRFGNYEFQSLFNALLITPEGYQFGDFRETISSVIGKNKVAGTLSKNGKTLDRILDFFDKNHSIKSIHNFDELRIFNN